MNLKGRIQRESFGISNAENQWIIALAGNPNVGKSTVFNALTGLRQHTGNWPGKTVNNAQGYFTYRDQSFMLVDLPGTYSLLAHSVEEEIARDFICFGQPDATVVVLDATSLERNLNLALQIMEITPRIIVCVNLMDEARKRGIIIDFDALQKELGVPVVATAARLNQGLEDLQKAIFDIVVRNQATQPKQIVYSEDVERAIQLLQPKIEKVGMGNVLSPRWLALRLLDSDPAFLEEIGRFVSLNEDKEDNPQSKGGKVAL
ncbi:Fe2+ transport system protein B [Desulfitobacterium dehalogenans ATCC 51507]|uniref:Fe2+ transport system protein B n=1 Tax=Desulfitobacterium dehalogenans (strain ATCC 51507 / DSM 9161 / JW/IU-DC1) TaxID=756499 RepID=I4AC60_DESDJ|nr:FeoB small GTPase domain-containing protein [Desulfitobacterium dehalogenans]AFM01545.1 Fe2+ transport system protein B [Desulfitobacterium dehalogenans ATCC 51507]